MNCTAMYMYLLYTVYTMHCIITIDCPLTVTVYSVNTAVISQLVKQCKPGHMAMYGDELQRAVKNRNCFYSQLLSVNGRKLTELQRKTIRWHLRQRISSVQRRTVNGQLSVRLSVWTSPSPRQRKAIRWHFVNVSLPPTWTSPSKSGRLDVSVCCINRP